VAVVKAEPLRGVTNRERGRAIRERLCTNCQAERRTIEAKGLCRCCYRIAQKISQIKKWNPKDKKTLKGFPRHFILRAAHVSRMKADVLEQLKALLEHLRIREQRLREPVDSMMLESKVSHVATLAGARTPQLMHGTVGFFDSFTPAQRRTLFELLNNIEEDRPCRIEIDWSRYLRRDSR